MKSEERIQTIKNRLEAGFSPEHLEVVDDSRDHIGHAGAEGGAGHYTVIISSDALKSISRVEAHRQIYQVVADLIPHEIHALKIKILT